MLMDLPVCVLPLNPNSVSGLCMGEDVCLSRKSPSRETP